MKLTKQQRNALIICENAATEWLYLIESKRRESPDQYDPREADWLREQIDIVAHLVRSNDLPEPMQGE